MDTIKILLIVILVIVIITLALIIYNSFAVNTTKKDINNLTDNWIKEVTINNSPEGVYNLFCNDATLLGTVSKVKRRGKDIKKYFDYFAKLPSIKVINREYNISQIVNNVYVNSAFITWSWKGLEKPIVARMTFIFRNKCIFQLHSSGLPELNKDLYKISGSK